jgi:hypothetical protein
VTVVGLHPEELLDKLLDGKLCGPERERLDAHLASCEVCRFEHAARADFAHEALSLHLASQPPELPLRPLLPEAATPQEIAPLQPAARAKPAPRRRWVLALAAAALIVASGAVASGVATKASYRGLRELFAAKAEQPAPQLSKPRALGPTAARPSEAADGASTVMAPAQEAESPSRAARTDLSHAAKHAIKPAAGAHLGSSVAGEKSDAPEKAPSESAKSFQPETPAAEPQTAAKLFGYANQARRAGDVARASGLYYALQARFPGSPEAELSRVTLSLLLLDTGDARGALAGFDRYLAGASHGLEAEALVGRARALGRLGRRDQEAVAWREVARRYPRSVYGRQASERLAALGQP